MNREMFGWHHSRRSFLYHRCTGHSLWIGSCFVQAYSLPGPEALEESPISTGYVFGSTEYFLLSWYLAVYRKP